VLDQPGSLRRALRVLPGVPTLRRAWHQPRGRPRLDDVYVRRGHQPVRVRQLIRAGSPPCWCALWRSA